MGLLFLIFNIHVKTSEADRNYGLIPMCIHDIRTDMQVKEIGSNVALHMSTECTIGNTSVVVLGGRYCHNRGNGKTFEEKVNKGMDDIISLLTLLKAYVEGIHFGSIVDGRINVILDAVGDGLVSDAHDRIYEVEVRTGISYTV